MLKLFGPVLFYDMVRMSRRSRYLVLRCLYILILLAVLYSVYQSFAWTAAMVSWSMATKYPTATPADLARFGEMFFGYFLLAQYVVILLITPAYVAGAIAEEKQRKTLEYILTTDLSNREIVLGKVAARLGFLMLFLLAGLPVVSFAQLFGGIPPELLWAGFGASLLTVLSLTGISILASVYAQRVRDALLISYLAVLGYFVGWGLLEMLRGLFQLDPPAPYLVRFGMDQILTVYKSGNPFIALFELVDHVRQTGSLGDKPFWLLLRYGIFHVLLTILTISLSVVLVRSVYIRQAFGPDSKPKAPSARKKSARSAQPAAATAAPAKMAPVRRHPPVSERQPMLWKEVYVERGLRIGVMGQSLLTMLALVLLMPGLVMFGVCALNFIQGTGGDPTGFAMAMNFYVRWAGMIVAALIMIGVGIRAASSIGAERDRMTLEGLLSTPLSLAEILLAKWLGSFAGMRWLLVLLGLIWLMGLLSGGIHPLAICFMAPALLAYCAFAASLGMLLSVTSRTSLRAALGTVATLLLLGITPWFLGFMLTEYTPRIVAGWDDAFCRSLSPFFGMEYSAFYYGDLQEMSRSQDTQVYYNAESWIGSPRSPARLLRLEQVSLTLVFMIGYALAAAALLFAALDLFTQSSGRIAQRKQPPPMPLPVEPRLKPAT